jgi:DNA polymerase-3 subunit alpha
MANREVVTAGMVSSVRFLYTKDGRPFAAAVLEDLDGQVEVTAWPEVFEQTRELWEEGVILLVEGRVKVRGDRVSLNCERVRAYQPGEEVSPPPQPAAAAPRRRLMMSIAQTDNEEADLSLINGIFAAVNEYPGTDEVRLRVTDGSGTKLLRLPGADYCPELHAQLTGIVGEGNLKVE